MTQTDPPILENPGGDSSHLRRSLFITVIFIILLWLIKIIEVMYGISLIRYGIFPGQLSGLPGILWAPLIHSSFTHLMANTLPLLVLGTLLLYGYPRSARIVIPAVYLFSGLGVWLFARQAIHIGISGLTFGFLFFVLTVGILRWDRRAIALSMIVFFLYGGMIWGVIPNDPDISFESHFFGALSGLTLAVLLKDYDPRPVEKKYSWEEDDETDAEPGDNSNGESS